ncbi:GntR family transcriptional regulator [Nocardioides baekrokdamisoli]|uniref:GntR family transcriptional regulator n=1 Tax=Nocardioides baekrokdamisoli TaxID=1804624 RepID=A0A3G9IEX6_9ACTN|nr:GntR family transcriptional regulator [Nocardioides baekrokdamisoli]
MTGIRDLRLRPGASLSETELSEHLQVSRTPLREAIARLVEVGLVTVVPQVGTHVALIKLSDVEQAQFVREHLEVAAFDAACRKEDRDFSEIYATLDRQERARKHLDYAAFFAADEAFHAAIFELSGYPGAWRALQPVKLQLDRLRRLSLPEPSTVAELIDEHRAILAALETADIRRGKAAVSKHARRVLRYGPELRREHPDLFA